MLSPPNLALEAQGMRGAQPPQLTINKGGSKGGTRSPPSLALEAGGVGVGGAQHPILTLEAGDLEGRSPPA